MSGAALRRAVRDHLRQQLSLKPDECKVRPDGRPPAHCPNRFVAVHPGAWSNSATEYLEDVYGVRVTVTVRTGDTPYDRLGEEAQDKVETGLDAWCHRIRALLHGDNGYRVVQLANQYLAGDGQQQVNGFVEPLRFLDGGQPEARGAAWFRSRGQTEQNAGLSQTLTFGGAVRDQTIESQT